MTLARRLLMAGGGSGSFTPEDNMRVVAYLTRLSNIVHNDDTKFPWDTARVMDEAYCTWAGGATDGIVIVASSWYWVHVDITTLGTDYGGASNADYTVLVSRNGITLSDTLIGAGHLRPGGAGAGLMHTGSPVYLEAGDEVFVYTQNALAGTLLIESNPSDGAPSGYLADAGPGTIGPHLILVKLSGLPPA